MPRGRRQERLPRRWSCRRIVDDGKACAGGELSDAWGEIFAGIEDDFVGAGRRGRAAAFSSVETVVKTRAPRALAIWMSRRPMPPAPAWMRTSSPGWMA